MVMKPNSIDGTRNPAEDSSEDENSTLEDAFEGVKNVVGYYSSDSFMGTLISRMNPASCLNPDYVSDVSSSIVVDTSWFEPSVTATIKGLLGPLRSEGRGRTAALQKIYRLTDREHESNRYVIYKSPE